MQAIHHATDDGGVGPCDKPEEEEPDAIHHEGTGKLRLARLHIWAAPKKGKIDIEQIEEMIADLNDRFHLQAVGADTWQASYLIERLKKRCVPIEAVTPTSSNLRSMCSATLEAFSEGNIELYGNPILLSDLRALRVVEKSYGVRLESPRGPSGHGDAATALSIALHIARKNPPLTNRAPEGKLCVY